MASLREGLPLPGLGIELEFEELTLAWVSGIRGGLEGREGKSFQTWVPACVYSEGGSSVVRWNRVQEMQTFGWCEGHGDVQEREHDGEADHQSRWKVA
jgi:hypothetical protein